MMVMAGAGPRTAAMGVATTTNAHSGSWSRARALECTRGCTGGSSTSGRSKSTQHILVVTTSKFGLNMLPVIVLDEPGHRESTARPLKGPFSYGTAAEKIISDSKRCAPTDARINLTMVLTTIDPPRENAAPDPPFFFRRCGASPAEGDAGPRRGLECRRRCDDSELGERLINPQPVPVLEVWRDGMDLIKFGDRCKQVRSEDL